MSQSSVPDRGEIGWVNFDPQAGREQAKRRPGLVLTSKKYNAASGLLLVCPITSKQKQHRFEVEIVEEILTRGVVLSDQVHSYDWRARNFEFREHAPQRVLQEVLARVAALLEL